MSHAFSDLSYFTYETHAKMLYMNETEMLGILLFTALVSIPAVS